MNDRVLDVKGAENEPGVKVITYSRNDSEDDNQLWYEDRFGCIRSKMGDWAIDTNGQSFAAVYAVWPVSYCRLQNCHREAVLLDSYDEASE